MDLLDNAIISLRLALEDYSSSGEGRLLSAVRNLHAGILLLYKEKLRRLSPAGTDDVLIKAKSKFQKRPNGEIISVGVGKKTADAAQIRERFEALGVQTHWDRFEKVNDLRNEVEHYFPKVHRDAIAARIADTFLIIRDFIHDELKEDPMEVLGTDAWEKLLSVSEVVEREHDSCRTALAAINWGSDALAEALPDLSCAECGSPLLFPVEKVYETKLQCRSCGEEEPFERWVGRAISEHFAGENFRFDEGWWRARVDCLSALWRGRIYCRRESLCDLRGKL